MSLNLSNFTFTHALIVAGGALTTIGPLLVHYLSPTTLGEVSAVVLPIGAFVAQVVALFAPSPSGKAA